MYREEEREMNKYCQFAGIGIIPWGPLNAGVLARPPGTETTRSESSKKTPFHHELTDADKEILKRVEKLAKEKGWKMAQVALAWSNAKVTSPIVGYSSVERIDESIIPDKTLTPEEIKFLEEPYKPVNIRGHA